MIVLKWCSSHKKNRYEGLFPSGIGLFFTFFDINRAILFACARKVFSVTLSHGYIILFITSEREGRKIIGRILVVDDAAFMRMMLKDILTKGGHQVIGEAANGMEAIKKYDELKPDVVTMDITMPEMEGIQALREIRKTDPAAKVIMCSAMGQQAMVIDAIQAGAKEFIIKPFQADRVLNSVNKILD
jgi:two-component system chemotaxis response regulator CheY